MSIVVYRQDCSMRSFKKTTRHVYAFSIFPPQNISFTSIYKISISFCRQRKAAVVLRKVAEGLIYVSITVFAVYLLLPVHSLRFYDPENRGLNRISIKWILRLFGR